MTGGEANHQMPGSNDCVMTITQTVICPKEDVSMTVFFLSFFTAIFYIFASFFFGDFFTGEKFIRFFGFRLKEASKYSQIKDRRWLAIHINSPGGL